MGWRSLSVMVWAMTAGSFTAYAIAVLAPLFRTELGLSRTEVGSLAATMFVVAALVSPGVGRLIDRLSDAIALGILFAAFMAAMVAMAGAPGFWMLAVAAAVGGFVMTFANPVTNRIIAHRSASDRRGWATGIKQAGGQLSAVIAGFGLPLAAQFVGWRGSLVVAGMGGLIGMQLTWMATRGDGGRRDHAVDVPPMAEPSSTGHPDAGSADRLLRWLIPYGLFMGAATGAVVVYLPLYAFEALGMSAGAAGATAGVVGTVGFLARISWGPIGDRFETGSSLLLTLSLLASASCVLLGVAQFTPTWFFWLGIVGFGLSGASWNTPAMLVTIKEIPPASVGTASGRVLRWMYTGLLVSPPIMGWIVDRTDSYTGALLLAAALALSASAMTMIGRDVGESQSDDLSGADT